MLDQTSLQLLRNSSLSDKQAKVYLALLQLGRASVTEIAQTAGLKRAITYVILGELSQLGYVNQLLPNTKKKIFTATDPNTFATRLEQTAREFNQMLPYLRALQRRAGKPFVTYFEGVEGIRSAFQQIRKPKTARYALSIQEAKKFIPKEVERWQKTYLDKKGSLNGRHLLTDTPEDRAYGQTISQVGQQVRYLAPDSSFNIDFALVDNQVFLTTLNQDLHVTVIESPDLYASLCTLFDLAWQASRA